MHDLHQTMTDRILASVDEAGQWKPCWQGMTGGLPTNASTGKRYNGVNILSLWLSGYGSNRWASYNQWQALGAQVRKGERGTPIIFYKVIEGPTPDDNKLFARGSKVFNAEQVDGAPAVEAPPITALSADQRLEALDRWLMDRSHVLRVQTSDSAHAYYQPALDTVYMPDFSLFHTPEHFYGTLFHEATHWTGHKSRLDRLANYIGEGRAKEELVAELGAAFLCAEFGIEQVTRDDHVSYIASWLKHLKNDKRCIVTAASQASKAVELLNAIQPAQQQLAA
jgi:antirestriction protein ArdC